MSDEKQAKSNLEPGDFEDDELNQLLARAERLAQAGDYDDAIDLLDQAAERAPDSPLPHHNLSVVFLMRLMEDYSREDLWGDLAEDEGDFEEAVAEAEEALDIDPNFIPARNNLARLFAVRGWWEDAIEHWEISLSAYPDQPQVREELADARKQTGQE